jgi:hypothetical protein
LRSSLSAHRATGYEINFECRKTGNAHSEIVRWNGPLGDFTYLSRQVGGQFGVAEGDVIKATIVGSVITVFKNGVQVAQARDGTFATGQPGMGFDKMKGTGSTRDYAFSRFSACDQ